MDTSAEYDVGLAEIIRRTKKEAAAKRQAKAQPAKPAPKAAKGGKIKVGKGKKAVVVKPKPKGPTKRAAGKQPAKQQQQKKKQQQQRQDVKQSTAARFGRKAVQQRARANQKSARNAALHAQRGLHVPQQRAPAAGGKAKKAQPKKAAAKGDNLTFKNLKVTIVNDKAPGWGQIGGRPMKAVSVQQLEKEALAAQERKRKAAAAAAARDVRAASRRGLGTPRQTTSITLSQRFRDVQRTVVNPRGGRR